MNILLVSPEIPATLFSFKYALKFLKKSASPPLGLLTIASMLPDDFNSRLVDLNIDTLKDSDLKWADYVFLSGMDVQKKSFREVAARCNSMQTKVIAGGPMVTFEHELFPEIDHFVLKETEDIMPEFIRDLKNGELKKIYADPEFPDINTTFVPKWDLLNMKRYHTMNIQYSRGCPFNCEFCSISTLNGRKVRTKNTQQFLEELESLRLHGWKGSVFVVDDNFIGKREKLKNDVLPAIIEWSKKHDYPFNFLAEASIDLSDDPELMSMMVDAGFDEVFVGIETPNSESLSECDKRQNLKRDMIESVKTLQRNGLIVTAGFIVGFDSDPPSIFEDQASFIQKSGIVAAMVGILNAPPGSRLFTRLRKEGRLVRKHSVTGDNTDGSTNIIPKMNYHTLTDGYKNLMGWLYSDKKYYERIKTFLSEYKPVLKGKNQFSFSNIPSFSRLLWKLGVATRGRWYFWKLLMLGIFRYPRTFPTVLTMAAYGFHFRKVIGTISTTS
ncbi:MAG: DUF4070 domain-containing protein [Candidatus Krumholzibacteriota bacterium]|nr:DUF4070 domain-containing protein [Candidatus Krumholzibacteriota bacterium]